MKALPAMARTLLAFSVPINIVIIAGLLLALLILVVALLLLRSSKRTAQQASLPPQLSEQWKQQYQAWEEAWNQRPEQQSLQQAQSPAQLLQCPYCGNTRIQPGDMFCLHCGNRLRLASSRPSGANLPVVNAASPVEPKAGYDPAHAPSGNPVATSPEISELPTLHEDALATVEAPPSQSAHPARLLLRNEQGIAREYVLYKPEMSIGRSAQSDILLDKDKLTSRRHATIRLVQGHYVLQDEHSANGTYVNGQQIAEVTPQVLHDGDLVRIGANEFIFRSSEHAPAIATSSYDPAQEKTLLRYKGSIETANTDEHAPVEARVVKAASTSPQIERSPIGEKKLNIIDHLRFTAFYPKEVTSEAWNTLLVYGYVEPALEAIYRDADQFRIEGAEAPSMPIRRTTHPLPHEKNITIVPECRGLVFNPRRTSFKWQEDWHRSIFRFSVKERPGDNSAQGRVNIFMGPLLIASLKMDMRFEDAITPEKAQGGEVTAQPYHRIFASYSYNDTAIVHSCRNIGNILGLSFLTEAEALRTDQKFSGSLRSVIESAELFQLFWSANSAKSGFVRQEWEYALERQKHEDFLRPVYWEVPLVTPPPELASIQFSYLPLYTFSTL